MMDEFERLTEGLETREYEYELNQEWSFGKRWDDESGWSVLMKITRADGLVTEYGILPDDAVMIGQLLIDKANEVK